MKPDFPAHLGTPVWRTRVGSSPRSVVWSAEVGSTPVIVKQAIGGSDVAARFARELTALRLAASADPPLAPRVLGADPDHHVLVLEHLAAGPLPPDWPVRYATALARLHSTTVPDGVLPRWSPPGERDVAAFLGFARALDVAVPRLAGGELHALLDRLATPAGSLLHGDPCARNDLYTSAGLRFVDFEQAALGDGSTELAYLRIGFPTCWLFSAPDAEVLADAERAYRATVAAPVGDLTDACAGWLVRGDALVEKAMRDTTDHLAAAVREDWAWGTATARQRLVHRLGVVADVATDDTALPVFGRLCAELRDAARIRWPRLRPVPTNRATARILRSARTPRWQRTNSP